MDHEAEYLKLFRISERKYIIGIYQDGITVFNQQRRALNIFHSLVHIGELVPGKNYSVAVIGGGIAGLTFAAAALKSNISVSLFEKEASYLHMQSGCDTRKVHPNIYDWPNEGSTFPNARLPVLSWTQDTASNVVKQILRGVEDIKKEIGKSDHTEAPGRFSENLKSNITKIEAPTPQTGNRFTIINGNPTVKTFCNVIIYAVGYGIEKDLENSDAPSYWRNDAFGQSILNNKRKFMISGTGDGALIDLCRIKIRNFNYDRIIELLKSNARSYQQLINKLQQIKTTAVAYEKPPADFYVPQFEQNISKNYYRYFWDLLKEDIVRENEVVLQNRKPWEESFDFKKISMLNALLVFILKQEGQFEYWDGELEFKESEYLFNKVKVSGIKPIEQFIIRRGTDKSEVVKDLFLTGDELKKLTSLDDAQQKAGPSPNCWTFESISRCFLSGAADPNFNVMKYDKRSEYVTPDTRVLCLPQMISLAQIIKRKYKGEPFRLALHRVSKFDEEYFFQQIIPYQGSESSGGNGSYQNVYTIDHGVVGEAWRTGRPLMVKRLDDQSYSKIEQRLHLQKRHKGNYKPGSYLAIPISAPSPVNKKETTTCLIFYMDAVSLDFFEKEGLLELIVASLQSLISYTEQMVQEAVVLMSENETGFKPPVISSKDLIDSQENPGFTDLSPALERLYGKAKLAFKEFYSFDIIYNK